MTGDWVLALAGAAVPMVAVLAWRGATNPFAVVVLSVTGLAGTFVAFALEEQIRPSCPHRSAGGHRRRSPGNGRVPLSDRADVRQRPPRANGQTREQEHRDRRREAA